MLPKVGTMLKGIKRDVELLSSLSYPTYCLRFKEPGSLFSGSSFCFSWESCYNKTPRAVWLQSQEFLSSQCWRVAVQGQGAHDAASSGAAGLAAFAASLFGQLGHLESLWVLTPSSKDASDSVICCCCLVANSYLTLCDPVHCSPPGSSIHGILQARTLEWVAISFSRGSSWSRITPASPALAGRFFITEPLGNAGTLHQP